VLGLVGAFVGWLIFTALFGIADTDAFDLGAIIAAVLVFAVNFFFRRSGRAVTR
jgi:uncharacterized membrane protein YeaQ/YmgE (transglycosylase-associated protein family)